MLDLLPVQSKPNAEPLGGKQELLINGSLGLLRGLADIGQVNGDQLLRVKRTDDAMVHVTVSTNDGFEPVIAHKRIGKGAVIYYGIKDQRAVDLDPQSYAVIWGRIIDYSIPDPRLLNVGTGAIISSSTTTIITPMGKRSSPVIAARNGIYQAGISSIAANLYPLRTSSTPQVAEIVQADIRYESVISESANISMQEATRTGADAEEVKVPLDLSTYLIIAGMIAMLVELIYIKFRGDL
jgi:hypothetical protein